MCIVFPTFSAFNASGQMSYKCLNKTREKQTQNRCFSFIAALLNKIMTMVVYEAKEALV
jgi:hypothetical protein